MKTLITLFFSCLTYAAVAHSATAADNTLIAKGEYVARTADCMACHTVDSSKPYAGGLAIESPFGKIYSTNITPYSTAGIGNYTEEDFANAVRKGKRKDGSNLYPAMPYPSYSKMNDEDIHALYIYFRQGVKPIADKAPETDLSFPFNQRWGISMWNIFFSNDIRFNPNPGQSDEVNRGAYLVQGAGHCGSCHTPRAITMQEKTYTDSSDAYLAGTELNDWYVPGLRAGGDGKRGIDGWSKQDIVDYLQTGRNKHASAAGEMRSVVQHSTSHMTGADLNAIAAYLKTLVATYPQGAEKGFSEKARQQTEEQLSQATNLTAGQRVYLDNCTACHFVTGQGAPSTFPPLVGNSLINADNPTGVISIILNGSTLPATDKAPAQLAMPDFGWRLSDQQVADLTSFIRQGWGNQQKVVTASEVEKVRKKIGAPVVTSKPTQTDGVASYH
ncbi:cytochrome c [Serratia surfactantfaciens]|uniref:cytochrome c n=1 Tax=Serratia surfactantfaciens TaxID=2741499 RepID=UPI0018E4943D|nr:cytochrome c [Serratia surfactantfaciens]MBI6152200.1 cytochrome c [Serratia surfactantfaciens]